MELILGKNLYQVHISGGGKAAFKPERTRIPFQLDWPKEVSDRYPHELLEMIKEMLAFVFSPCSCLPDIILYRYHRNPRSDPLPRIVSIVPS